MNDTTVRRLLQLNRQFYQSFAATFSISRYAVQPGVKRVIGQYLAPRERLLDAGCGNGGLMRLLARTGFAGHYLGVDSSRELMDLHPQFPAGGPRFSYEFLQADLADPGWDAIAAPFQPGLICCFAVVHHLPGKALRQQVFRSFRRLLPPGALVLVSCWQFLESKRLATRLLPWEAAGLDQGDVEAGDHLLDWRGEPGRVGMRYVHHFSAVELESAAADAGFSVLESFPSDGQEGNLALYQAWRSA